jgi:hypothetical protein
MVRAVVLVALMGFAGRAFGAEAEVPKKEAPKKEAPKAEAPGAGEEEGRAPGEKGIITIGKRDVQYNGKTGKVKIVLSGKVDKLPPGTKVTIDLEYNFNAVGTCLATVGTDGTFSNVTLAPEVALPPGDEYELQVKVVSEPQAPSLREQIMKIVNDEKTTIVPFQGKISLGSDADRKAWRDKMAKAMKGMLDEVIALNNDLVDKSTAADKDVKAGTFKETVWREFLDKQWRPKVVALQKKYDEWLTENPSLETRFKKGVWCFYDMLALVAVRSKIISQTLYGTAKLKAAIEDVSPPPELRMEMKQVASLKTDKKALEKLNEFYKVVEDDFGLKPPDDGKGKKEPAKKEPAKKEAAKKAPAAKEEASKEAEKKTK